MASHDEIKFGVFLPSYVFPGRPAPTAGFLQDFARRAEDVGFDGVWVFDHLFDAPPSYRVIFMEPLTSLALAIGATRRVRVGTGILVLPLRNPVLIAKELANLDVLSEGRLVFGAGVGWDEREFQACQIPKETRGRRMDEMLEIITGLWTNETFSYEGTFFRIPEIRLEPQPVQRPHPPILIAGGTVPPGTSTHITTSKGYTPTPSLVRAARMDGLMTAYRSAPGLDTSQLEQSWRQVGAEARAIGRDPATLHFAHQDHMYISSGTSADELREALSRFSHNTFDEKGSIYLMGRPDELIPRIQARIDAGVREILINFLSGDPNQLDLFMRDIRPHLRPPQTTRPTA